MLVKAKIAKHAAGLMVEDAKFWVVEPRISLSGVSGLNTLLSGNYIGFQAGKSTEPQTHFRRARRAADRSRTSPAGGSCSRPTPWARSASARRSTTDASTSARWRPTPRRRRQVGRHHGIRPRALRQVRHDRDTLLERERDQRHVRCGRRRRPHGVARGAALRAASPSTRPTSLPAAKPAAENADVHAVSQPHHRDEAAGSGRAALRALFQRVGARTVGRRAGDALRLARSARSPTSA